MEGSEEKDRHKGEQIKESVKRVIDLKKNCKTNRKSNASRTRGIRKWKRREVVGGESMQRPEERRKKRQTTKLRLEYKNHSRKETKERERSVNTQ